MLCSLDSTYSAPIQKLCFAMFMPLNIAELEEVSLTSAITNSQENFAGLSGECCSYTSSNRESWGRCSSLGGSDEVSVADSASAPNSNQVSLSRSLTHMLSPRKYGHFP